jgi:hypothetical protein
VDCDSDVELELEFIDASKISVSRSFSKHRQIDKSINSLPRDKQYNRENEQIHEKYQMILIQYCHLK